MSLFLYRGMAFAIAFITIHGPSFLSIASRVKFAESTGPKPLRYKAVRRRGNLCNQRGGRLGWLVMMRLALTTRLSTTDLAALSFAVAGLVLFPIVRCAHDDYARLIFLVHKPALPGDRVSGMSSSSHRHS